MAEASSQYDALVLGGGPGGATAGLVLAKAGWRVAIIEKRNFPRRKVCGDFLSAATLRLLAGLGVEPVEEFAGPEVRHVGLFEGDDVLKAPMPKGAPNSWGRAVGREHLDELLLSAAGQAGARLWQPWTAKSLSRQGDQWHCSIRNGERSANVSARIAIVATGTTDTQVHSDSDLLGFKAYYSGCDLAADLMPLLVFPGGYGGLVHCKGGRVSLSCCIQRSTLRSNRAPRQRAAAAVLEHILTHCAGARNVLTGAAPDGTWLAAGPIRPGIRQPYANGIFFAGNAAGEAHPIIAEGISMAIQSGWLLSGCLAGDGQKALAGPLPDEIGRDYEGKWLSAFALRIRSAALFAAVAIHPGAKALARPVLQMYPGLLTFGAYLSGKGNALKLDRQGRLLPLV